VDPFAALVELDVQQQAANALQSASQGGAAADLSGMVARDSSTHEALAAASLADAAAIANEGAVATDAQVAAKFDQLVSHTSQSAAPQEP